MTTMMANGRARKSLADQIDRLDGILDGLADALNQAVAEAVKEAVAVAVRAAVAETLANAELRRRIMPTVERPSLLRRLSKKSGRRHGGEGPGVPARPLGRRHGDRQRPGRHDRGRLRLDRYPDEGGGDRPFGAVVVGVRMAATDARAAGRGRRRHAGHRLLPRGAVGGVGRRRAGRGEGGAPGAAAAGGARVRPDRGLVT